MTRPDGNNSSLQEVIGSRAHVRNLWENADSAPIERNGLLATVEGSCDHRSRADVGGLIGTVANQVL